jgi:hypothetical protein
MKLLIAIALLALTGCATVITEYEHGCRDAVDLMGSQMEPYGWRVNSENRDKDCKRLYDLHEKPLVRREKP